MTLNARKRTPLLARCLACGLLALAAARPVGEARAEEWRQPRTDLYGVFSAPFDRRSPDALQELGVGWLRQQIHFGDPARARRVDRFVERVLPVLLELGIGVWLTLYHRDPDNILEDGTVGYLRAARGGFPPADLDRYEAGIEALVARLRDSVAAAGKTPAAFLVVQFGNEVMPRDVRPPDHAFRFWHGTGNQYLEMLAAGHAAVKRVDPDIPVAAGGISSAAMEAVLAGDRDVRNWNHRLLKKGRFDYADVHLRHDLDDVAAKLDWVTRRWRGPLAATEVAGPDPRIAPFSEAAQARDLEQRLPLALEHGVDRVFWASLTDNAHVAPVHQREGLIEPGPTWRPKPAFHAYKALIAAEAD